MVKFEPIGDRIVVTPIADERSEDDLIVPDNSQTPPTKGKVIACGPGHNGKPMQCEVGDIVYYDKYSGAEMKLHGDVYRVMRETDCLTKIKSE